MLGVEPMLGRTFASDEDTPGHNVVLLSYGLWQRRYGGVSSILGQTIDIDRQPYTVVVSCNKNSSFPCQGQTTMVRLQILGADGLLPANCRAGEDRTSPAWWEDCGPHYARTGARQHRATRARSPG